MERSIKNIAKHKLSFIEKESQFWLDNDIISNKQRVDIIGCYSPLPFFASFLTVAGACLIGLAILSYIASNWGYLSAPQKIAVILTSYLIVAVPAIWVKQKGLHFTSSIFFLLLSFVFGGGLFLISQTFHDGQPVENLLLWWLTGVAVVFLLTKDRMQLVLSQIIAVLYFYMTARQSFYNISQFYGTDATIWNVLFYYKIHIIITAIFWVCTYHNLNRLSFNLNILLSLALLFGLCGMAYRFDNSPIIGFVLGLLFIMWLKYYNSDLLLWGLILTTIFGMILTSPGYWHYSENVITLFIRNAIGLSSEYFNRLRETDLTSILCITSGLIACAVMIAPISNGSISAMVLFSMFVMRFYFDTFYDFLPKAIFFAVGGLILIGIGMIAKRVRARGRSTILNKNNTTVADDLKGGI